MTDSTITRYRFEEMCDDYFHGALVSVECALKDAHVDKAEIKQVLFLGGSSRIPKVQRLIQEFFESKPPLEKRARTFLEDDSPVPGPVLRSCLEWERPDLSRSCAHGCVDFRARGS